jgi:hypothetical protein
MKILSIYVSKHRRMYINHRVQMNNEYGNTIYMYAHIDVCIFTAWWQAVQWSSHTHVCMHRYMHLKVWIHTATCKINGIFLAVFNGYFVPIQDRNSVGAIPIYFASRSRYIDSHVDTYKFSYINASYVFHINVQLFTSLFVCVCALCCYGYHTRQQKLAFIHVIMYSSVYVCVCIFFVCVACTYVCVCVCDTLRSCACTCAHTYIHVHMYIRT